MLQLWNSFSGCDFLKSGDHCVQTMGKIATHINIPDVHPLPTLCIYAVPWFEQAWNCAERASQVHINNVRNGWERKSRDPRITGMEQDLWPDLLIWVATIIRSWRFDDDHLLLRWKAGLWILLLDNSFATVRRNDKAASTWLTEVRKPLADVDRERKGVCCQFIFKCQLCGAGGEYGVWDIQYTVIRGVYLWYREWLHSLVKASKLSVQGWTVVLLEILTLCQDTKYLFHRSWCHWVMKLPFYVHSCRTGENNDSGRIISRHRSSW